MKKLLVISALALVGVVSALPVFAANYVDLSSVSSTALFAYAGGLFSDLWVLIAIAIGVPLAFYIIRKVISIIPKR